MITIQELRFEYRKNKIVLSTVDLTIAKGSICGLLGKNGAGKTTLLKLICGLLFPKSGKCSVFGQDPSSRNPEFLRQIYYLPEEIYMPNMSVSQFHKAYSVFYPNFDDLLFLATLDEFQLSKTQLLSDLSYGEKKKILISFGLATRCPLFILDEPTNGLDIPSKVQFRKLVAKNIQENQLLLISTHQLHDIEKLIDTIIILDAGEVVIHSDINEIMHKLSFERHPEVAHLNYLHFENDLSGYKVMRQNLTNEETNIDLELFFNGVLANKLKLKQLLGTRQ
ncbi:MAG: ABC transporter ATP-binding protein [Gammaproteobacteria bacterium]|nr:ABC transporter ATP-binding protein [Gammaproteobacteria bacterium]